MAAVESAGMRVKSGVLAFAGSRSTSHKRIEQLRGARPAGRIGHEGDGGALMGRRVGFLREQVSGERLRSANALRARLQGAASIAASSAPAIHETTCSIAQPCGQNTTQRGGGLLALHRIEVAAPVIVPVHEDAGPRVNGADQRERVGNLGVDGRHDANEGGEKRRAVSGVLPALMQFKGGLQRLKPCHVRNPFGDQNAFVHERGHELLPPCIEQDAADDWSAAQARGP